MSFHFNFDVAFDFPPPPPRSSTQAQQLIAEDGSSQPIKTELAGWLQTAQLQPRYSLRLLYLITSLTGIILDNVVLAKIWGWYSITDLHRSALGPLVVGFFWQFLTLYDKRLFRGRQLPNWAIAVMETLGYVAFLVLLVSNAVAIDARRPYGDLANPDEMMLVIYASAVWIILCVVHCIIAFQCYILGWRNVRPERAPCSQCTCEEGKGKGRAADDEEPLLGDEEGREAEGDAGPSEPVTSEQYRDEEDNGRTG